MQSGEKGEHPSGCRKHPFVTPHPLRLAPLQRTSRLKATQIAVRIFIIAPVKSLLLTLDESLLLKVSCDLPRVSFRRLFLSP